MWRNSHCAEMLNLEGKRNGVTAEAVGVRMLCSTELPIGDEPVEMEASTVLLFH